MVVHHVSRLFSMLVFHFSDFSRFPFSMLYHVLCFQCFSVILFSLLFHSFCCVFHLLSVCFSVRAVSCVFLLPTLFVRPISAFFPFSWCVGPLARRRVDAFCVEFARGKFMSGKKEQTRKGTAAPAVGGETPQAGGPSSSWWSGGGGVGDRWHESGRSSWWWSDAGGGGDPRKPHQRQSAST